MPVSGRVEQDMGGWAMAGVPSRSKGGGFDQRRDARVGGVPSKWGGQ